MTKKMIYARIQLGIVMIALSMMLYGIIFQNYAPIGWGILVFTLVALFWGYISKKEKINDRGLRTTRLIDEIAKLDDKDQVIILQLVMQMADRHKPEGGD